MIDILLLNQYTGEGILTKEVQNANYDLAGFDKSSLTI